MYFRGVTTKATKQWKEHSGGNGGSREKRKKRRQWKPSTINQMNGIWAMTSERKSKISNENVAMCECEARTNKGLERRRTR